MDKHQIIMDERLTVRSNESGATLCFKVLPETDKQGFWIKKSENLYVNMTHYDCASNERKLQVTGINEEAISQVGYVTIVLDDGTMAECEITILPEISSPPRFVKTPEIIFADGKAIIDYELSELGDNKDKSDINWYRVDNKDRSYFADVMLSKKSNESDGRKIAVSRNGNPCKELRLTSADIGKHLKVNIKPMHDNSEKGQGLNIVSRIVKPSDVNEELIVFNPQTVVISDKYEEEPGYYATYGDVKSDFGFGLPKRPGIITESMGCGICYMYEKKVQDMSLVMLVEPECVDGTGFAGPHQYMDIYIKYDPKEKNGYALRIEGTAANDGKVIFCLYRIKNGNGTPVSDEYISDAFKPGCEINLQIRDDIFNAFISYDDGEDFADVELRAKIRENEAGGFGFKYMAEPEVGYRCCIKYMEACYGYDVHND